MLSLNYHFIRQSTLGILIHDYYVHYRVFTLVFTELIDRTLRGQRTKSGTSTMT